MGWGNSWGERAAFGCYCHASLRTMLIEVPDIVVVSPPSWIDVAGVIVALFAALVSAGAAAIIAFQAVETRKATSAAQEAVKIARKEFERGQAAEITARRAAIDAEMPRLGLVLANVRASYFEYDGWPIRELAVAEDERFTMPLHRARMIGTTYTAIIMNDGPRAALVHMSSPGSGDWPDEGVLVTVPSNGSTPVGLKWYDGVGGWVDRARAARGQGESGESGQKRLLFTMSYTFPGTVGAAETHELFGIGSLLRPVPDNEGEWAIDDDETLDNPGRLRIEIKPWTRKYFARTETEMGWF